MFNNLEYTILFTHVSHYIADAWSKIKTMCCTITYHHIKYCGKLSEQWHKYWKLRREEGENVEKNFLHLSHVIIEHNINIMTSLTSKWKLRGCIGQSKNWGTSLMSLKISWWTKISILLKKKRRKSTHRFCAPGLI